MPLVQVKVIEGVFSDVSCGAEIDIVQEGIPNVIPTDACYLGWQESPREVRTRCCGRDNLDGARGPKPATHHGPLQQAVGH
jgi:hypothetical protein